MFTGVPVVYGIDPKHTESTPQHQLGTMGVTSDGRTYRYAQNAGTELAAGKLCIAPDITTNHEDIAVNTFAIGDTNITVTLGATAITGNEYNEGFVAIVDGTGEGHFHKIKNAPATDASGDCVIELYDPIEVAAVAATTVTLYRNKFRDVLVSDGTQADLPVGVPNVVVAADYYCWLQTGGPCTILVDANDTTAGQPITIGDGTTGAVETHDAATEVIVGMQPAGVNSDVGEYGVYELTLD